MQNVDITQKLPIKHFLTEEQYFARLAHEASHIRMSS